MNQELGEENYNTYESIYDIEDKEWVLKNKRLKDDKEIAKRDFFRRIEEEEQELV